MQWWLLSSLRTRTCKRAQSSDFKPLRSGLHELCDFSADVRTCSSKSRRLHRNVHESVHYNRIHHTARFHNESSRYDTPSNESPFSPFHTPSSCFQETSVNRSRDSLGRLHNCRCVFSPLKREKRVAAYVHLGMSLAWVGGYIGLFWLVKKHKTKIMSLEGSPTIQLQTASLEYESEAAKTSAILVASSLLCFFPDIVLDFMGQADESRMAWGFTILFLSSSLNPCLIVWRSHQFRAVLTKTLRNVRQWKK
ncbi:hypothetical protein OS493_010074 [Desmophyllum pertusum]|uniref:G-protein coupled receptors family 1 profile domain-containing protein n=1 Tax=Desmophyllum pertusum TaxID=174260 RepID=A0A9W9YHU8_9CNID|nr:hypothetical protein OS493_010074 [Desmophyllum pertusum]